MTQDEVVVERRVAAAPSTVFSYFSERSKWLAWQGTDAEIDARPGGTLRVNVTGDGFASGEFVEVIPDQKVVFTWGWENPGTPVTPGSSTVQVDLIPDGDGTIIRLTHRGLPETETDIHRSGWENYVGRLATVAEGGDPGPDPLRGT